MSDCEIVVPCFNEELRLDLEAFSEAIKSDRRVHFCFVDDGSRDQTASILGTLVDRYPTRARLIRLESNCGKAEAVRQGLLACVQSSRDYVGYWDADLATPLSVIPQMLDRLIDEPRLDGILGSRVRRLGARIERSFVRHYAGRVFGTMASLAIGLPVYDTQCGAKMFRVRPWLGQAMAQPFNSRWIFDVELLSRYVANCAENRLGPALYEWPLTCWEDVRGSKLRLSDAFTAFFAVLALGCQHRLRHRTSPFVSHWAWQQN